MRKVFVAFLIATAGGMVVGSSAGASGSGHWICGPRGSVQLPSVIEGSVPIFYVSRMPVRKATSVPPKQFYRVSIGDSRSCALLPNLGTAFLILSSGEIRTTDASGHAVWVKLQKKIQSRLRKLVDTVKPYPAPTKIRQVVINDQIAARPASYLHLYSIGSPTRGAPSAIAWTPITFYGAISPWTDGKNVLSVSKRGGYLERDGQVVRIPGSIAARIRRAQPIPK